MSKMLGCSGITTLSASFMTSSRRLPCRPAGVSSTTWVVPLGGRTISSRATSQVSMRGRPAGRNASQVRADCCRSTSPSMT